MRRRLYSKRKVKEYVEVTPDIDLDSIYFTVKYKKKKLNGFPYFWFCVYDKGSWVIISRKSVLLVHVSLKIDIVLANSAVVLANSAVVLANSTD